MILIIGLGNPGIKYKKTRHNIGFRVLDEFKKENNFPRFKLQKKFQAEISQGIINSKKIILVKPQTFMNSSGRTAKSLTTYYKLTTTKLLIIHDDLAVSLGKIKIIQNRGSAGHKGVESITKELGTNNFLRFRIGITPAPSSPPYHKNERSFSFVVKRMEKFVLEKFTKEEEKIIKQVIKKTCGALKLAILETPEKAMNEYNK